MKAISDREVRRLFTKLEKLRTQSYHLGTMPLDEPRFVGYKRTFVLTEFARFRSDKDAIQRALDICNTVKYSKDKTVFDHNEHDERSSVHRFNIDYQFLCDVSEHSFNNLELDAHTKKLFYKYPEVHYYRGDTGRYVYSIEKPRALFELKVSKHYITEIPVFDSQLDESIDEITNYIRKNNLWPRINKVIGRSNYKDEWDLCLVKHRANSRFDAKLVIEELEDRQNNIFEEPI